MNKTTKDIPKRIFALAGGGLGDIYYSCLVGDWTYFEDIKEKSPDTKIHAVMSCTNSLGIEFPKYNPYIDRLEDKQEKDRNGCPLTDFMGEGYVRLSGAITRHLEKRDGLFLGDEDKRFMAETNKKLGNKYIVLHPFSGDMRRGRRPIPEGNTASRFVLPIDEYYPLVDKLIGLGYKVVVVGGNKPNTPSYEKQEYFDYQPAGLVNLIDQVNSRTAAALIKNASGWVGTYSCYCAIAWWSKIRTVLTAPIGTHRGNETWEEKINTWPRWGWAAKQPQNMIIYLPPICEVTDAQRYKDARKKMYDWFKEGK